MRPSTGTGRKPVKLVYLAALHNSGSTVISLLCNAHPELLSPGELIGPTGLLHRAEGPACSCGVVIARCPFWSEVGRRFRDLGHDWTPGDWRLHYRFPGAPLLTRLGFGRPGPGAGRIRLMERLPLLRSRVLDLHARNEDFSRVALEVAGKSVLLDASKHPQRIPPLSRIAGFDLRVVHLIRDPRGWCNSRRKHGQSPAETAPNWVRGNRYIARLSRHLPPDRRAFLRYEDFCSDPQGAIDLIFRTAALDPVPLPEELDSLTHHLLGNRMRTSKRLAVRQDLGWQQDLSEADLLTIRRETAGLAAEYGYDL